MRAWEQLANIDPEDPKAVVAFGKKWRLALMTQAPLAKERIVYEMVDHPRMISAFAARHHEFMDLVRLGNSFQQRLDRKGKPSQAEAARITEIMNDMIREVGFHFHVLSDAPFVSIVLGPLDLDFFGRSKLVHTPSDGGRRMEPLQDAEPITTFATFAWDFFRTLEEGLPIRYCGNCGNRFVATKRQAAKLLSYCETCRSPDREVSDITPARRAYMRSYMQKKRAQISSKKSQKAAEK